MDQNSTTCPLCDCDVLIEDCVVFHSKNVCKWCVSEISKDYPQGRKSIEELPTRKELE